MPKYLVSLACLVPVNFENTIEADTEEIAIKKAIEKYHDFKDGDFSDEFYEGVRPDWDNGGIHVEIKN